MRLVSACVCTLLNPFFKIQRFNNLWFLNSHCIMIDVLLGDEIPVVEGYTDSGAFFWSTVPWLLEHFRDPEAPRRGVVDSIYRSASIVFGNLGA